MQVHQLRRCWKVPSIVQSVFSRRLVTSAQQNIKQEGSMAANKPTVEISDKAKSIPENVWVKTVRLVGEYKPVNLGQGYPDFAEVVPQLLKDALIRTQMPGADVNHNQYCRGQGHPSLVKAIADIYSPLYGRTINPMTEVITTVGGYEALHCVINGVLNPGDEMILIEPFFDCYSEIVRLCGGVAKFIPLKLKAGGSTSADFVFDRDELAGMFNEKTKAILVNTPHNPTGKVFDREEIEFIANLCKKHNCLYISDEVYEWLVYDGHEHVRAATLPDMWERTVTVCSAGKTFNVTGWKTGWAIGPEKYISATMAMHSGSIYTIPTPLQVALAEMFEKEKLVIGTEESYWYWLNNIMSEKRQRIHAMLTKAGFKAILPQGGYFICVDLNSLEHKPTGMKTSGLLDANMSEWMIKEKGLASIPVSAFFSNNSKPHHDNLLRFCFIKGEDTLDLAEEKFNALNL